MEVHPAERCMSPQASQLKSPQSSFIMSPPRATPDISTKVADLVGRFNTLEVKDRDEEKMARQLKRLEAALRRAEIAREEAESEVKHLRAEVKDIKEVGEEWVEEKRALKGRCEEFEKKYEKAKAHFRAQRTKYEESTHKAAKEFMEREKQHWRNQTAAEEEIEWERKLRVDAHDLIAFMEIERQMTMRSSRQIRQRETSSVRADSAVDNHRVLEDEKHTQASAAEAPDQADQEMQEPEEVAVQVSTRKTTSEEPEQSTPEESQNLSVFPSASQDEQERTPEPEYIEPLSPPKKQTLTVPIKFGDEDEDDRHSSDKENSAPTPVATPIRPASALATSHRTPATVSTSTLIGGPRTPSLQNRSRSEHRHPAPNGESWNREIQDRTSEWNIPGVLASADLDRAAALAAIQARRGRARSLASGNSNSVQTPRKKSVGAPQTPATEIRRDLSAPVGSVGLGSMSVGRVKPGRG